MEAVINVVEIASILASARVKEEWLICDRGVDLYVNDGENETRYSDKAQEVFIEYYDYYFNTISDNCEIK
jgi:hypothetical protein